MSGHIYMPSSKGNKRIEKGKERRGDGCEIRGVRKFNKSGLYSEDTLRLHVASS